MRKKRKNNSLVLFVLFALFVLLSFRVVFYFLKEGKSSKWQEKASNCGIAILGKDFMFAEINNSLQKIYVIKIPKNTKIINRQFGDNYTLDGIFQLGKIDFKTEKYFKSAISSLFAAPVDAFYKNSTLTFQNFDFKLSDVLEKHTDITIFDYFAIKKTGYKIQKIDLEKEIKFETNYFKEEKQINFNQEDLDHKLSLFLQNDFLSKEELLFKIVSRVDSDADVEFYERLISNLGFKLSDLEFEEKNNLKKNACVFKNKNKDFQTFSRIFICDIKIDESLSYDVVLRLAD